MANTPENINYNAVIESLEKAQTDQKIDKTTIIEAKKALDSTEFSQDQKREIQELLNDLSHLSGVTKIKVQETLYSVELNPKQTLKELESIKLSQNFSKFDEKFTNNLKKQLDFCKTNHPDIYIKLVLTLVELTIVYEHKLNNSEVSNNSYLDGLIKSQGKEFQIILNEKSLDLENNTLDENFALFSNEKNALAKNVILDYIYEEEIKNKNYSIEYNTDGYTILDNAGKEVKNPQIESLKKHISKTDLNIYKKYQESEESKLINTVPVLGDLTVAQIVKQAPAEIQKQMKISETSLGKLAIPGLILGYLFGFIGPEGQSFGKRLFYTILGGLGLKSANEMGFDFTGGIKDAIDNTVGSFITPKEGDKLRPWDQVKTYTNTYNALIEENNKNTEKIPETFIKSFFGFCYNSESFKSNNIGNIKSYINGSGTIGIRDIFGEEIPKSSNGTNIPETEIKKFLSLLITQEETSDTFGKDLLTQGEITKKTTTLAGGAYKKNKKNESLAGGSKNKLKVDENLAGGSKDKLKVDENLTGGSKDKSQEKNILNGGLSKEDIINNELIRYETLGYLEPGKVLFLAADKSDTPHYYEQLSPELKDVMFKYQKETTKVENLLFIIQNITANEDKPELNTELRNQLLTSVNDVNIFDFDNTVAQLNQTIIDVIANLPEDSLDLTNRLSVLNYIREQGNTAAVATEIVSKNFHELNISPEDLSKFIKTGFATSEELKALLEKDSDLVEKISNKESEVKQYIAEIQDTILPEYKELYPDIDGSEILANIQNSIIDGYAKGLLYETHLASKMNFFDIDMSTRSTNSEEILFAEMKGVGTFDFSDENNALFTKEAITFVAVQALAIGAGLLTMGAGTVAINALVYGTKAGKVFKTIATTANATGTGFRQGGKILGAQIARTGLIGAVNGASFYTGYATVHGIDSDALANGEISYENSFSMDGFIDSAMFGVAGRAFQGLKMGNMLSKAGKNKVGKIVLNNPKKFSGLALAGAFGINETLPEEIQLEPGEWSKEEIMSVLMFVGSFYFKLPRSGYNKAANHTAGQNFKFSRGNGNIQVQMGPPRPTPVTPPKAGMHNQPNAQKHSTAKVISKKLKKVGQKIKDTFKF